MANASYYEGHPQANDRDPSPDYAYAGGSGHSRSPYPPSDYQPGRVASPGHTTYYPPSNSQKRIGYDPEDRAEAPSSGNHLQVPSSRSRPRSLPPPPSESRSISRWGDDGEPEEDRHHRGESISRARSPIQKARKVLGNTFSDTTTGLGVGVLGALVGGLAAHEAAEATSSRHGGGHRPTEAQKRNQLISTVVGAAVGALGANAVEKRLEVNREKDRVKQEKWEQKWGKAPSRRSGELVRRDSSSRRDEPGWKRDWDWDRDNQDDKRHSGSRGRGSGRDIDPDARSWKNVEDWVYDDRDDRDYRRGRRSDNSYRY